ncbi:MAG: hypothetical protein ACFB8W_22875 [Elainellaceae cyanobacterium]
MSRTDPPRPGSSGRLPIILLILGVISLLLAGSVEIRRRAIQTSYADSSYGRAALPLSSGEAVEVDLTPPPVGNRTDKPIIVLDFENSTVPDTLQCVPVEQGALRCDAPQLSLAIAVNVQSGTASVPLTVMDSSIRTDESFTLSASALALALFRAEQGQTYMVQVQVLEWPGPVATPVHLDVLLHPETRKQFVVTVAVYYRVYAIALLSLTGVCFSAAFIRQRTGRRRS